MYPRFIGFFGPDGVGKTTHTNKVYHYLKKKKKKVKMVWIRGPHTIAFVFSKILEKTGHTRIIVNPYGREKSVPKIGPNKTIKQLWAVTEFISVLPLIFVKAFVPLFLGYTIVADRYVLDTIVSIAYYLEDINFIKGKTSKILLGFVPRDGLMIHLDSDYNTLMNRRGRLVEPKDFIDFQKECYGWLSKQIPCNYLDTSFEDVDKVYSRIVKLLGD